MIGGIHALGVPFLERTMATPYNKTEASTCSTTFPKGPGFHLHCKWCIPKIHPLCSPLCRKRYHKKTRLKVIWNPSNATRGPSQRVFVAILGGSYGDFVDHVADFLGTIAEGYFLLRKHTLATTPQQITSYENQCSIVWVSILESQKALLLK